MRTNLCEAMKSADNLFVLTNAIEAVHEYCKNESVLFANGISDPEELWTVLVCALDDDIDKWVQLSQDKDVSYSDFAIECGMFYGMIFGPIRDLFFKMEEMIGLPDDAVTVNEENKVSVSNRTVETLLRTMLPEHIDFESIETKDKDDAILLIQSFVDALQPILDNIRMGAAS